MRLRRAVGRMGVVFALWIALAGCGDGDRPAPEDGYRLPIVEAPLDTAADRSPAVPAPGSPARASHSDDVFSLDADPPRPTLPTPGRLAFTHYQNQAYRYSIAYPDTLFHPVAEIGEGRGREFATRAGDAHFIVYADEIARPDELGELYHRELDAIGPNAVYHALETDWFVVTGRREDRAMYQKTILRGGLLKTFRIEYDLRHAPYYETVTAIMAASMRG